MTKDQAEDLREEMSGFGVACWLTQVAPNAHGWGLEYRGVTPGDVPLVAARIILTPEEGDHLLSDLRANVVKTL